MGQWLSNPIMIILVLLILILLIVWWFTLRNRVPVLNCDTVLPPEACNPNWLDGVTYRPMSQLPRRNCDGRLLNASVGQCTGLTYPDANGQEFAIQIEGADAAAVEEYINTAQAYFLVQQVGRGVSLPPKQDLPSLEAILVEKAVEWSGLSESQLSAMRDELATQRDPEAESVTLEDVLMGVEVEPPLEPEQVLKDAITRATEEYRRPEMTPTLPQAEIDSIISDIPKEMRALMREPGATFLFDPDSLPVNDPEYRDALMKDSSSVLISLKWASAPKTKSETRWVVWFSIDPPLRGGVEHSFIGNRIHNYTMQRGVRPSVGITAQNGSMRMRFWQEPPGTWSRTVTVDVRNPKKTTRSYEARTSGNYNVEVTRVSGQGPCTYMLSGGWVQE